MFIKGKKVIKSYRDKKLRSISKKLAPQASHENYNIGVIDTETFRSSDGTNKIYALGFKSYVNKERTVYYIEDEYKSDDLVLKLINELLTSKYSKTIFYCHNFGGYDVIFILKVLISYNSRCEDSEKYNLSFNFRDNRILSMTIKKDRNKLEIRDSYAIFNSSLKTLSIAYGCDVHKGDFPYKFVTNKTL